MEEALAAYLLATSSISGLVGNRVTWGLRDQGSPLPAISMSVVSAVPVYSDGGEEVAITNKKVQIDCWGLSYGDAKAVARNVRTTLSGVAQFTYMGVIFRVIEQELEHDLKEMGEGAEPILYRTSLDYELVQS